MIIYNRNLAIVYCFILRTPFFVCPIEKRAQDSLFFFLFIETIKTGLDGTVSVN